MKEIIDYIEKLETDSFEGWSEDAKRGYLTACSSIKAGVISTNKYRGLKMNKDQFIKYFMKSFEEMVIERYITGLKAARWTISRNSVLLFLYFDSEHDALVANEFLCTNLQYSCAPVIDNESGGYKFYLELI